MIYHYHTNKLHINYYFSISVFGKSKVRAIAQKTFHRLIVAQVSVQKQLSKGRILGFAHSSVSSSRSWQDNTNDPYSFDIVNLVFHLSLSTFS